MFSDFFLDIPAAVSLPHFLDADPSLMKGIQGLKGDPEKHKTTIYLQPVSIRLLNLKKKQFSITNFFRIILIG